MDQPKQKTERYLDLLIGTPPEFGLEARIYNAVAVITLVMLTLFVPVNFAVGLSELGWLLAVTIFLQMGAYYLNRVLGKLELAVVLHAIGGYIILGVNFFFNSGSHGPSVFLFFLTFSLLIAISTVRLHWAWVIVHISVPIGLMSIELVRPEWVPYTYSSTHSRFVDLAICYMVSLGMIYAVTRYLRSNYSKERQLAERRAQAIEAQNALIVRQNQDLERLNAEKTKLFSIVSHDIRNPLASIQGYLELLNDKAISVEDGEAIQKQLLDQTRHISSMLSDLLVWSRAQMDGIHAKLTPIDLGEVVGEVLKVQQPIAESKSIRVHTDMPADVRALADIDLTSLVFRNVFSNAVKFTPVDGCIRVEVKAVGQEAVLSVKDNGVGIDPERRANLFAFRHVNTLGTQNEHGLGLGLFLSKEFMDLQAGRIWFDSEVGQGSTFYMALPLAESS